MIELIELIIVYGEHLLRFIASGSPEAAYEDCLGIYQAYTHQGVDGVLCVAAD